MPLITSSATAGSHNATKSVTSRGPTVNMTSCATASMAYATWTRSSLPPSTPGHNARSPPSRGGVNNPATTTAVYATTADPVPASASQAMPSAETTAAGNCTRGCPYRSTARPSRGCPTALATPYAAASAPARL